MSLARTISAYTASHTKFTARFLPASKLCVDARSFAIRYRDCNSNPIAAVSLSAALPTSCYAHPIGFEIRCAQPVKHPNPYPAVRSPLRRSHTEPHGSRVLKAAQILTGRFRNRKLVVSRSHSKRFFAEYLQGCIFTSWQCDLVIDRWT